ncbi:Serine/threonine-protein kinase PrkC [Bacteroidales bacterium Barb6XT]|nr:Serine/threonine-protein kinase PrkC [Bacteroidales bacterium Barb6XT]
MNLPDRHLLQNGKYRLTCVVGQGGFGITYKGVWLTEVRGSLGKVKTEVPIAVKEYFFKDYCYRDTVSHAVKVHSETGKNLFHKFKEKLIKEAKILSEVHHPHIVNVLEVFEENNTAYIAMEYISGSSLKMKMEREGILPEGKVLKYIRQTGEALQFVHEKNIIHLDIKPSNILIDNSDNAYLIDFGVSKRFGDEQEETSTTMLALSRGFASIEQYDSEGTQNFSPYPDIYSLGATMYNLLTGRIPTESILRATRSLPSPSSLNPAVTPETEEAILKAMQIDPSERFESVRDMLTALPLPPKEEETTAPLQASPHPYTSPGDTEEQTVLNLSAPADIPKGKRNTYLRAALVTAMIAATSAIAFSLYKQSKEVGFAFPKENGEVDASTDTVTIAEQVPDPDEDEHTTESIQQPATALDGKPDEQPVQTQKPLQADIDAAYAELAQADRNAAYAELVESGQRKMNANDYAGARADFRKAKTMKPTDTINRLITDADTKIREQQIALQYEVKNISFGNLRIVKSNETSLYGAIDSKGNERIPCKYLYNEKIQNGRAFARIDDLFDVYNNEGVLVSEGVTRYY